MDRVDMNILGRVISVFEGLIYVFGTCRSRYYEVWTQVHDLGIMRFQFGFSAKSLSVASDYAYYNYLDGNICFDSEKAFDNAELFSD